MARFGPFIYEAGVLLNLYLFYDSKWSEKLLTFILSAFSFFLALNFDAFIRLVMRIKWFKKNYSFRNALN
jgi:hypothetical protein